MIQSISNAMGEVCYWMHDLFSMEGFEKGCKLEVAVMRALQNFEKFKGVFKKAIETIEFQKDLLYATKSFTAVPEFYVKYRTEGLPALPTTAREFSTFLSHPSKLLLTISSVCDTAQFMKRFEICQFTWLIETANSFGTLTVFGNAINLTEIPIVNRLFIAPKEFFIFVESGVSIIKIIIELCYLPGEFWRGPREWSDVTYEKLAKLANCIGKMVLIHSGQYWFDNKMMCHLTPVDLATQMASMTAFICKNRIERASILNP